MHIHRSSLLGSLLLAGLVLGGCTTAINGSAENIAKLERERAAEPQSEAAQRSLGIAYYRGKRYDDARSTLQHASQMDPKDGVTALYLGLTAESQNDLPAARSAYETYLAVGKTAAAKRQIQTRLQAIKLLEIQAEAKVALAKESQLSSTPGAPNTVAVMPFRFTGSDTSLKPLERGFAELVTTDLSRSPRLTVVERMRLQAILDEMALQQRSGSADGTGVRAGKVLQVSKMVGGSIDQQGDRLQTSAIVTDVSTTAIGTPATDNQTLDQLFTMEKNIVFGLFNSLGVTLTTAERNQIEQRPTRSLAAFLAYSRGLALEDQGRFDDASRFFDNAVRLDPGFVAASQKSQEVRGASAGTQVTTTTVESSLRGTAEGTTASMTSTGPTGGLGGTANSTADGLNPSTAGGATSGGGSTTTQPNKDPSSGTGGDNPTTKTAKVSIVIHQPGA